MVIDNPRYVNYLDSRTSLWKRPEGPPRVWRVVDGLRKTASGEIPRFSVQEVPKELIEDVEDFLVEHFIPEEPACVNKGIADDPLAVREYRTVWKNLLDQGVSIVALRVNPDPTVKPVIAGVNIVNVVTAEDVTNSKSKNQFRSSALKTSTDVLNKVINQVDVLKRYGVDKYLYTRSLSVHPSLRGQGLGEEIFRTREDIGRAYQIPLCETLFTATVSQILAARIGYEVLFEKKYSELLDDQGKVCFSGINVEYIKLMAKKIY